LSAAAQDSTIDLFAGYSYSTPARIKESSFKANGGDASIAFNLNRWASFVAEAGGVMQENQREDVDANAETFLFGPKISFFAGPSSLHSRRRSIRICPLERAFNGTQLLQWLCDESRRGTRLELDTPLGLRLGQVDYLFQRVPTSTNSQLNNFAIREVGTRWKR